MLVSSLTCGLRLVDLWVDLLLCQLVKLGRGSVGVAPAGKLMIISEKNRETQKQCPNCIVFPLKVSRCRCILKDGLSTSLLVADGPMSHWQISFLLFFPERIVEGGNISISDICVDMSMGMFTAWTPLDTI